MAKKAESFKVNANETVAFVGKSGTGKTTIIKAIVSLIKSLLFLIAKPRAIGLISLNLSIKPP